MRPRARLVKYTSPPPCTTLLTVGFWPLVTCPQLPVSFIDQLHYLFSKYVLGASYAPGP